ncbi:MULTISPECIES: hypothetical protein [Sporosarcina]|uniref:Nucleotide kinase n=1 Tax=Sporosarcina contaminans TaxID=633403 RepID=A0ABW3TXA7_9BACL
MIIIYGTITEYMGTAYTGHGIAHKYDTLIASADRTIFLKCPPTHAISIMLNDAAAHFLKRGHDVDRFMNPANPERTDAIYVKDIGLFILQASYPVSAEPLELGGRHSVISFYDIYDEERLKDRNREIADSFYQAEVSVKKTLRSLSEAITIHDEWEQVNINRMMWDRHADLIDSLKKELFGTMKLHKESAVSHRLIGSLSSGGSHDFIPSITNRMKRRILMKGLSGSGKSTLLKALGKEAEERGVDVLYGWCGLDPNSVDLILFPELSVCLFDATKPHEYDPDGSADELLDLVPLCEEDKDADQKIEEISARYREKILDASGYMHAFAQAESRIRTLMDQAIVREKLDEKAKRLTSMIGL